MVYVRVIVISNLIALLSYCVPGVELANVDKYSDLPTTRDDKSFSATSDMNSYTSSSELPSSKDPTKLNTDSRLTIDSMDKTSELPISSVPGVAGVTSPQSDSGSPGTADPMKLNSSVPEVAGEKTPQSNSGSSGTADHKKLNSNVSEVAGETTTPSVSGSSRIVDPKTSEPDNLGPPPASSPMPTTDKNLSTPYQNITNVTNSSVQTPNNTTPVAPTGAPGSATITTSTVLFVFLPTIASLLKYFIPV